jgi:hypothetical protein
MRLFGRSIYGDPAYTRAQAEKNLQMRNMLSAINARSEPFVQMKFDELVKKYAAKAAALRRAKWRSIRARRTSWK